jgi:hypothetical protein
MLKFKSTGRTSLLLNREERQNKSCPSQSAQRLGEIFLLIFSVPVNDRHFPTRFQKIIRILHLLAKNSVQGFHAKIKLLE